MSFEETAKACRPFAVYWRNPKTRVFEKIPHVSIIAPDGIPVEINPAQFSKWYTITSEVFE